MLPRSRSPAAILTRSVNQGRDDTSPKRKRRTRREQDTADPQQSQARIGWPAVGGPVLRAETTDGNCGGRLNSAPVQTNRAQFPSDPRHGSLPTHPSSFRPAAQPIGRRTNAIEQEPTERTRGVRLSPNPSCAAQCSAEAVDRSPLYFSSLLDSPSPLFPLFAPVQVLTFRRIQRIRIRFRPPAATSRAKSACQKRLFQNYSKPGGAHF